MVIIVGAKLLLLSVLTCQFSSPSQTTGPPNGAKFIGASQSRGRPWQRERNRNARCSLVRSPVIVNLDLFLALSMKYQNISPLKGIETKHSDGNHYHGEFYFTLRSLKPDRLPASDHKCSRHRSQVRQSIDRYLLLTSCCEQINSSNETDRSFKMLLSAKAPKDEQNEIKRKN